MPFGEFLVVLDGGDGPDDGARFAELRAGSVGADCL